MEKSNNTSGGRRRWHRIRNTTIAVVVLVLAGFVAVRFYYPFGEGVKTGQLNFIVHKGVIFKTYEGRLIQSGFRTETSGALQSNQFDFSVIDKAVADSLMGVGGQMVELHYREYFGALPWRGYSKYIVDGIRDITPVNAAPQDVFPLITPQ